LFSQFGFFVPVFIIVTVIQKLATIVIKTKKNPEQYTLSNLPLITLSSIEKLHNTEFVIVPYAYL